MGFVICLAAMAGVFIGIAWAVFQIMKGFRNW